MLKILNLSAKEDLFLIQEELQLEQNLESGIARGPRILHQRRKDSTNKQYLAGTIVDGDFLTLLKAKG